MIIKSKFKDYYDFIANQFGGGDPKVVYLRSPLTKEQQIINLKVTDPKSHSILAKLFRQSFLGQPFSFKIISVFGHFILISSDSPNIFSKSNFHIFSENKDPILYKQLCGRNGFYYSKYKEEDFVNKEYVFLKDLSILLKHPVFTISRATYLGKEMWEFILEENIPILKDFGIPSLINANQAYQEISHYISNVININPDILVTSKLSDSEKVLQHGFDLKKSFRHRKQEC